MSRSSARPDAAREEIGGRRRDDDQRGGASELDVIERVSLGDELRVHRPPGERLERDRADELTRRSRQHHVHFGAGLREQPRQPRRLVARDSPVTPRRTRRPSYGRTAARSAAAVVEVPATPTGGAARRGTRCCRRRVPRARASSASSRPLLERSRGKLVQHTGVLRRDEHREVLVRRVDGDFVRSEYAHGSRLWIREGSTARVAAVRRPSCEG